MKLALKSILYFAMVLTFISVQSCKKDPVTNVIDDHDHDGHSHDEEGKLLTFKFAHKVDAAVLEQDTMKYLNAAHNIYSVEKCQYFVSDITVYHEGEAILIGGAHYVDIDIDSTLTYSPGLEFEEGMYDSISMTIGLDTVNGATGSFVNAPESNMVWPAPMGGGYHYMKLEGKYDSVGVTNNFKMHYGPTMGTPYFATVTLPASSFTVGEENLTVNLSMNINKWFESPTTYDFDVYGAAIMGNMGAQMIVKGNAADVFSVTSIE